MIRHITCMDTFLLYGSVPYWSRCSDYPHVCLSTLCIVPRVCSYNVIKPSTAVPLFLLVIHSLEAIRFRMWWLFPTACIAGIAEIIGWSARLWSSKNPTNLDPFLIQYVKIIVVSLHLIGMLSGEIGSQRLLLLLPHLLLRILSLLRS